MPLAFRKGDLVVTLGNAQLGPPDARSYESWSFPVIPKGTLCTVLDDIDNCESKVHVLVSWEGEQRGWFYQEELRAVARVRKDTHAGRR